MDHKCAGCGRSFRTTQGLGLHWDHARKGRGGCTAMKQTEADDLAHVVEAYRADLARVTAERDAARVGSERLHAALVEVGQERDAALAEVEEMRAVVDVYEPDLRCGTFGEHHAELAAMVETSPKFQTRRDLLDLLKRARKWVNATSSTWPNEEVITLKQDIDDALRARKVGG